MDDKYNTIGKIFLKIPLALASPVIIGSGESESSDVDVLRDPVSGNPLIPATSLVGVFRSYLEKNLGSLFMAEKNVGKNFAYLFGDRQTTLSQSALQCDDVILTNARVVVRDGVAINHKTNTAEDKKKYNYEIVEHDEAFYLLFEITLRRAFDAAIFKRLLRTIFTGVARGHIRLGAKTNKGFGKLRLDLNAIEMAELNFTHKPHVWQWLSGNYQYGQFIDPGVTPFEIARQQFKIEAWFSIKNSLLIKSYASDPAAPDAVALCRSSGSKKTVAVNSGSSSQNIVQLPTATAANAGVPVMPGTSVMGAVRHRAAKILKTLGVNAENLESMMQSLFGFVEDEKSGSGSSSSSGREKRVAAKGRIQIEETFIRNVLAEIQTRIKIDRFTGGARHGALFEMMPLWQNSNDDAVNLAITLRDYEDWEAGLLLYILKDLWTGDLALGGEKNIGRGVLFGRSAKITWDEEETELKAGPDGRLEYDPVKFKKLEELFTGI